MFRCGQPVGWKLFDPTRHPIPRSVEEEARLAQISSQPWKEREAILRPVLEKIYRDPDGALSALNALASDTAIEPRKLAEDLGLAPDRLGRLRGSDLMVDGRAAREERNAAMATLSELLPLARAHATEFRRQAERFAIREQQRRAYMSLSIPALSKQAMARLVEVEAVRERGGTDAYKTAFSYAVEDRLLVQEIKAVNEALTARFGWSAFTAKADPIAERNVAERMPENLATDHREKLVRLFETIRRFSDEQHLAEKQDRSKVVAGACIEFGKEAVSVLPMLAAVTEFKTPIADEARERALAVPHYIHRRAALVDAATRVWRDPAGAVAKIEELVAKGVAGERIAAAVSNDPAAYGALRGSDRIMDKLLAVGRERKAALQAVPEAAGCVRSLGASYATAFEAETQAIVGERQRMAVAIPGLSQTAEDALRQLVAEMKKKEGKLEAAAGLLDQRIAQEFIAVSRALDERFGRNAVLRGNEDIFNFVSTAQRHAFEAMQEKLKVLQQIVRADSGHKIVSERQRQAINWVRGVER